MALIRKEIGDLLVDNGVITPEEWEQVRAEHNKTGDSVQEILSRLGLAGEAQLKNALELQYGVNFVTLRKYEPNIQLLSLLPERVIREHCAVPIGQDSNRLTVAMVDPSDNVALDAIKSHLNGILLKTVVCLEDDFLAFLRQAYVDGGEDEVELAAPELVPEPAPSVAQPVAPTAPTMQDLPKKSSNTVTGDWPAFTPETTMQHTGQQDEEDDEEPGRDSIVAEEAEEDQTITGNLSPVPESDLRTLKNQQQSLQPETEAVTTASAGDLASKEAEYFNEHDLTKRAQEEAIVLLANQILGGAIKRHCSNIHLIAGEKQAAVQYRLNGSLFTDRKLPQAILTALVARYKMMARLNLADQKMPQDGHIKVKSSSKEIVCLLSTVPTQYGENVVIWIL